MISKDEISIIKNKSSDELKLLAKEVLDDFYKSQKDEFSQQKKINDFLYITTSEIRTPYLDDSKFGSLYSSLEKFVEMYVPNINEQYLDLVKQSYLEEIKFIYSELKKRKERGN